MRFLPLNIASHPSESNTSERPGRPNETPETTGGSDEIVSETGGTGFAVFI